MHQDLYEIKNRLYLKCRKYVEDRISFAKSTLNSAQEEADEEIESKTANVHESGRSMTQVEKEKSERQLAEAKNLNKVLDRINPEQRHEKVELGSLVHTDGGIFFISIGIGRILVDDQQYFAISLHSPFGNQLNGHKVNDEVTFLNKKYIIKEIV